MKALAALRESVKEFGGGWTIRMPGLHGKYVASKTFKERGNTQVRISSDDPDWVEAAIGRLEV